MYVRCKKGHQFDENDGFCKVCGEGKGISTTPHPLFDRTAESAKAAEKPGPKDGIVVPDEDGGL